MLVAVSPGGFERFFSVVSSQGLSLSDDLARIRQIASEHHLEFVGPPLGRRR